MTSSSSAGSPEPPRLPSAPPLRLGPMAPILSFPFRIAGGKAVHVEESSDAGRAEMLAVLLSTRIGERPMVPGYGVTDPTFDELDAGEVAAGVALYGPAVVITGVDTVFTDAASMDVTVSFA